MNFAILLEKTELKVSNSSASKIFQGVSLAEENSRAAFGQLDEKNVISFLSKIVALHCTRSLSAYVFHITFLAWQL